MQGTNQFKIKYRAIYFIFSGWVTGFTTTELGFDFRWDQTL